MAANNNGKRNNVIQEELRIKEQEVGTVYQERERLFRDKYAKQIANVTKHFEDLPKTEFVIDCHSCAHVGKIMKQGKMYITPNYVLFYANILGSKVKKTIPFEKVVDMKTGESSMLMSSIEIHYKFKRFTFANFSHREKVFQHLTMQWKQFKDGHPFQITIPLDDKKDEDESENASLSSQAAAEPGMDGIHLETVWGSSHQNTDAIIADNATEGTDPLKKKKTLKTMTVSKIPIFYQNNSEGGNSKCSCFPCFR